jgi:hypothetical protein
LAGIACPPRVDRGGGLRRNFRTISALESSSRGDAKERGVATMIRKLKSGQYRLYSRKINPKTGKRRNLGTFATRAGALKHERAVQFFKRGH